MPSSKITLNHSFTPNSLVVGFMGEVGRALYDIFYKAYPEHTAGIDRNENLGIEDSAGIGENKQFDILHICIPYSNQFIGIVRKYQHEFQTKITVIHSTVPRGTSRKLHAIHSPIRGIHPNLELGIRTFPKFLGGENASEVADYFRRAGLKVILFDNSETTEAGKLFDTEYYRDVINFARRVKTYCNKHGLNFHEVYTIFNQTYNEGYTKLGMPEVVRPVLQAIETPIGGHCLIPNSKLIDE